MFGVCAVLALGLGSAFAATKFPEVTAPPAELHVPAFYKKFISAEGYPIVASERVNDYALKEAAHLVNLMLARRPDVRAAMIQGGSRLCILAHDEFTTDQPEFAWLGREPVADFPQISPTDFWDARARGTGGSETDPYCSSAEENLLGYPGDPYAAECILIHEFAHNIHLRGMVRVDKTFDRRLKKTYADAMKAGLWKGKYASVNHHEYFAEGVQSWFDNNRVNDHDHNHVNTRALLLEYDPGLAAMCREVFGDTVIKYTKPATRLTGHLAGYDPTKAPKFVWPERLAKASAEIKRQALARDAAGKAGGDREIRQVAGWTVKIHRQLLDKEPAATKRALELLKVQLDEIIRVVPASAVAELRKVPLWFSTEYPGVKPTAEYHPDADWLRENGRDPAMARGVEITDVRDFEKEMKRMPNFILHELAHGYHDRVLAGGFDNVEIKAAYERAKASKSYDKVERWLGKGWPNTFEKAYAMTSPMEYFAETTEAFFSRNDFFPFTRAELEKHDPGMERLLAKLWKTSTPGPARSARTTGSPPAPADSAMLTLDRIFNSDEFSAEGLGTFVWSKRTAHYFTFDAPKAGGTGRDLVRNNPAGGAKEVIVPAQAFVPTGESRPITVDAFEFSADESKLLIYTNSKRVWRRNSRGDYWVLDVAARELKKLGGEAAPATMMFAKFSPDGRSVGFVRENNLFVQNIRDLTITSLTTNGSATLLNGVADWVYEEELDLRDAWRWSPDSQSIAFWQFDVSGVRDFFLINNTDENYSRPIPVPYPKVGEQNSAVRVGVISARGGEMRWLGVPGDPRNHYLAQMEWTPDSSQLLLQQFNRLQNTNRVLLADALTGATHDILVETDPAWLENENPARWASKGGQFVWLSERSGWRHAYFAGRDGKHFSSITTGDFDVIKIESVDEKNGWLYYAASPDNPTQRYLYRTRLEGGRAERLTPSGQPGWHTYDVSPDAAWAVHTCSTLTTPPVSELIRLPDHKVERVLVANKKLRDNLAKLRQPASEFLRLDIGGKTLLDAWIIQPPGLNPARKYPLLFYVYGEPHGQTVRDAWTGQRGLWQMMLAQQGYVLASVDNRGTMTPRGREWRRSVHRQIGILAPQEQAAAARVLFQRCSFVDTNHVGIWGWSGGGSMSLNAILQFPDLYQTAMAIASVPNQRLYDSIYQERYMGSPDDNAEGYRRGSPLTYAGQLKGNLLLVHGTGDDNCHYQGVEMLMNELIAHHKPFTVMPYPNRSHGISEGRNTTRHLYALLTRYLHQNLPAPAAPKTSAASD